jgi:ferredoxin-NADP reductase
MTATTFTGTLLEKIPRGADTATFRFSRPGDYTFQAGQFYRIIVPSPYGPLEHVFSHADSPTEEHVELTTRLTGSQFKNALDGLPLGTEVIIEGPFGRFLFRYQDPKIAFLTGGIGITPVRSILRYLTDTGGAGRVPGQEIVLFYGCMTEGGIIYQEELEEYARRVPGLRLVYVITNPAEGWKGHKGFITADTVRAELAEPQAWTYYIVGPPPMITAMQKVVDELGIPESQLVTESFAGYTS